jgi:hypothetical protein
VQPALGASAAIHEIGERRKGRGEKTTATAKRQKVEKQRVESRK